MCVSIVLPCSSTVQKDSDDRDVVNNGSDAPSKMNESMCGVRYNTPMTSE